MTPRSNEQVACDLAHGGVCPVPPSRARQRVSGEPAERRAASATSQDGALFATVSAPVSARCRAPAVAISIVLHLMVAVALVLAHRGRSTEHEQRLDVLFFPRAAPGPQGPPARAERPERRRVAGPPPASPAPRVRPPQAPPVSAPPADVPSEPRDTAGDAVASVGGAGDGIDGAGGTEDGVMGGAGDGAGGATPMPARPADLAAVRAGIARTLEYPRAARRNQIEGRTLLRFILLAGGEIRDLIVFHGSGYSLLDEAALAAVRRAAPFHPPGVNVLVTVPVVFQLR